MYWIRRILIALLLLAGLHALAWYVLIPRYAPVLLERLITKLGASDAQIGTVRIDWGALAVSDARLEWAVGDGSAPRISAREIEFGFTLESLKERTFTSVRAAELSVQLPPPSGAEQGSTNPARMLASLQVPFAKAEVGHLKVEQGAQGLRFEGPARWDAPSLTLGAGSMLHPGAGIAELIQLTAVQLREALVLTKGTGSDFEISPAAIEIENLFVPSVGRFSGLELRFERTALTPDRITGKVSSSGSFVPAVPAESSALAFTGTAQFEIQPDVRLIPDLTFDLKLPQYDAGILLREISAQGKYRPAGNRVDISRARFRALGAEITTQPFTFVPGRAKNEVTTNIKGLDLQKLFEVYPQKKISGQGILDGEINIRLGKLNAISATGALVSRPEGGVLRGDLSDWRDSYPDNRGIAIAAEALEQFHYTSLQSGVEYQENGDLFLRIALKGANPEFNRGQQMNLNVTVEENLPALLKTMRYLH